MKSLRMSKNNGKIQIKKTTKTKKNLKFGFSFIQKLMIQSVDKYLISLHIDWSNSRSFIKKRIILKICIMKSFIYSRYNLFFILFLNNTKQKVTFFDFPNSKFGIFSFPVFLLFSLWLFSFSFYYLFISNLSHSIWIFQKQNILHLLN